MTLISQQRRERARIRRILLQRTPPRAATRTRTLSLGLGRRHIQTCHPHPLIVHDALHVRKRVEPLIQRELQQML
jgi:hypothetical protein